MIHDTQSAQISQKQDNHENNVPSRLSPQWLCGNSCIWAHDVRFHIAGTNEPKSAQQAKQGRSLGSIVSRYSKLTTSDKYNPN